MGRKSKAALELVQKKTNGTDRRVMGPVGRAGYNYFMVVRDPVGPNNAPGALLIEPTLHTHIPRTVNLGSGCRSALHD